MPDVPVVPVTVAVVSWNTRDLLARCLGSLAPEVEDGRISVWVVDNASTDGSADLVRERFEWAHLVASNENLGFGSAINLVAKRTTSEWLVAANADIALRPGAIDALLDAGDRDPGAAAIAPRLILPDGSTQHSVFAFPTLPYTFIQATSTFRFARGLGDRFAVPGLWDNERARRVPWAIAAFLLLRRSAWDEVGGFDDRQWMYAEDLDLGWRLRQAAWATRYEPRAHVDHQSSAATSQLFGEDLPPHWQRSTYGCIARRRGALYAWMVAVINLVGAIMRWMSILPASLSDPAAAQVRRAHARWAMVHLRALRGRSALEGLG